MTVLRGTDIQSAVRVGGRTLRHAGDDFYGALVPYALLTTAGTAIITAVADPVILVVLPVAPRTLSLVTIGLCLLVAGWMGESVIDRWTIARLKYFERERSSDFGLRDS